VRRQFVDVAVFSHIIIIIVIIAGCAASDRRGAV